MEYTQLVQLAKETARKHTLDPALVAAVVEQESDWQTFAIRYEPAFQKRYVEPQGLTSATEIVARSMSWGLMQLMGECARELGFRDKLASLCDPFNGLEWGCRHLFNKMAAAKGDQTKALLLWNGGGAPNYPSEVMARMAKYADSNQG